MENIRSYDNKILSLSESISLNNPVTLRSKMTAIIVILILVYIVLEMLDAGKSPQNSGNPKQEIQVGEGKNQEEEQGQTSGDENKQENNQENKNKDSDNQVIKNKKNENDGNKEQQIEDKEREDKEREEKEREDKEREDKEREDKEREEKEREDKEREDKEREDKEREEKEREEKEREDKEREDKEREEKEREEKEREEKKEQQVIGPKDKEKRKENKAGLGRENSIQEVVKEVDGEKTKFYISPPSYENVGRGLVYNCPGKHWACVDRESYFRCKRNYEWIKEKNKSPECVTVNAYASIKDCNTMQKYNINMVVPVNFCNN